MQGSFFNFVLFDDFSKYSARWNYEKSSEMSKKSWKLNENFFFRVTIVAICLVIVTFAILSLGISLVLFRHCGKNVHTELRCEVSSDGVRVAKVGFGYCLSGSGLYLRAFVGFVEKMFIPNYDVR